MWDWTQASWTIGEHSTHLANLGVVAIEKGVFWLLSTTVANFTSEDSSMVILTRIVNQTIIRSFKVNESVKLNGANNCDFMGKIFFVWYKFFSCSFKVKCIFIQNNAPSHVSKLTCEFFKHKELQERR